MRFYCNLLRKNNQGVSLLLVLFGVVFIATIGVIILAMATNYYISTIVDEKSSGNFYQAEGIVAEIKTGLQEKALTASEKAYKEVLENYKNTAGTTRKEKFSHLYLKYFAESLVSPASVAWDGSSSYQVYCNMNLIKELTKAPSSVKAASGGAVSVVFEKDPIKGDQLYLKNLLIDYVNDSGYRSTIQTDLIFDVPDYHFDGDSTFNEIKKYVVISDSDLEVQNTSGSGHDVNIIGAKLVGNIYANQIRVLEQSKAVFHSDTIVGKGDLNLKTGSDVTIRGNDGTPSGELWIRNILLNGTGVEGSGLYSKLDINGNTYVENDLAINDGGTDVTINGSYYGYSYNEENSETTLTKNSDYSSAILINGTNTTLKTPDLDQLILAGRAFISRNNGTNPSDIMMGESVAVKSNQIAYLVPEEYLTVGHNPVLASEESNSVLQTSQLLSSPIGQYLNTSDPVAKNFVSVTSHFGYVYYFLNFKDEVNANKYFSSYYSNADAKSDISQKAKAYIATTDSTGMKLDARLFLIAGNIIHNYYGASGAKIETPNYYDASGKPNQQLLLDGQSKGKEYVGRLLTLLPSGGTTMRLPANAPALVATQLIDFTKITNYQDVALPSSDGHLVVSPTGCTIDSSAPAKGIYIVNGDVSVNRDFEGLILATGKVTFPIQGVTCKSNLILLKNMMKDIVSNSGLSGYFKGIGTFDSAATSVKSISDSIHYANWSKNSN